MSKSCKCCSQQIPEARIKALPHVEYCVNCSSETRWSSVPIINHKTGNTIEVVKDPEVAAEFHRLSSRAGFGTLRGLRMGKTSTKKVKFVNKVLNHVIEPDQRVIDQIGENVINLWESSGSDKAQRWLKYQVESGLITKQREAIILRAITALLEPKIKETVAKVNYNPSRNNESFQAKNEEVEWMFKNWKK